MDSDFLLRGFKAMKVTAFGDSEFEANELIERCERVFLGETM